MYLPKTMLNNDPSIRRAKQEAVVLVKSTKKLKLESTDGLTVFLELHLFVTTWALFG